MVVSVLSACVSFRYCPLLISVRGSLISFEGISCGYGFVHDASFASAFVRAGMYTMSDGEAFFDNPGRRFGFSRWLLLLTWAAEPPR